MSSYLSKSKKAFKPKVPSSRPTGVGLAGSPQSSIRGSVDRQTQTPQPPHALPTHVNDAHATGSLPGIQEQLPEFIDDEVGDIIDELRQAAGGGDEAHPEVRQSLGPDLQVQAPSPPRAALPPPLASLTYAGIEDDNTRLSRQPRPSQSAAEDVTLRRSARRPQHPHEAVALPSPPPTNPNSTSKHVQNDAHALSARQQRSSRADTTQKRQRTTQSFEEPNLVHTNGIRTQDNARSPGVEDERAQEQSRGSVERSDIELLAEVIVNAAAGDDDQTIRQRGKPKAKKQKRKRDATPEEFESNKIAPTVVTMTEITKDTRLGKKSNRERRLQERDREAARKKTEDAQEKARREAEVFMSNPALGPHSEPSTTSAAAAAEAASSLTQGPPSPRPTLAPRVRLVNGQIVQDEESRLVDRHAAANSRGPTRGRGASQGAGDDDDEGADAVSEDELTRRINSGSYMRRERHTKWSETDTETFLEGLRMFGTDFMTISKLFPGRTRRQIKLKFNKEERAHPDRVQRALLTERRAPSIAEFERLAGVTLRSTEQYEKDLEDDRDRLVKEQEAESAAMRQIELEREAAARAEAEDAAKAADEALSARRWGKGRRQKDTIQPTTESSDPSEEVINSGDEVPVLEAEEDGEDSEEEAEEGSVDEAEHEENSGPHDNPNDGVNNNEDRADSPAEEDTSAPAGRVTRRAAAAATVPATTRSNAVAHAGNQSFRAEGGYDGHGGKIRERLRPSSGRKKQLIKGI